jgi:hypothetical protein
VVRLASAAKGKCVACRAVRCGAAQRISHPDSLGGTRQAQRYDARFELLSETRGKLSTEAAHVPKCREAGRLGGVGVEARE